MSEMSKELCEICGIKPRYGVYQNFGDLDNDYRLVTNVRKYRLIADTKYDVDDEDLRNLKPIYYPDFTQPENFVKLFNTRIPNPYITVAGFVTHFALSILATHDFLKRLVQLLQDKPHGCIKSEIEQIKQAIRKEEWIYD